MNNLIDLSDMFTNEFYKSPTIKKGKVLVFEGDEGRKELKIVRLNRSKKTCFAEEVKLYTEDEINAMEREDAEEIISGK